MANGEFKEKTQRGSDTSSFNILLEISPPTQRPILLGYYTEAVNAKTAGEFFKATDKIADLLRLKKDPARKIEETFTGMFGFNRGQAHNQLGFDYDHNADTVKEAFATGGFNCLSGNLLMAKITDELLKANGKLEWDVSMRTVIGTLASFSGGHVIAKVKVEEATRYYDMANTNEKGTVIEPIGGNQAKSTGNYVYFLGKEFTTEETEGYSHIQQKIRDRMQKWQNAVEKDFKEVPVEFLPYALRMIDLEDAMAILSRMGYETPADLEIKIKDTETGISISLYLMEGYVKEKADDVAIMHARFVAEKFSMVTSSGRLEEMKISHQLGSICKAYDFMKEAREPQKSEALYNVIVYGALKRPIETRKDALELANRIGSADINQKLGFFEIMAMNAVLISASEQNPDHDTADVVKRLSRKFFISLQKEGIEPEMIFGVDHKTRTDALIQLFKISTGDYGRIEWNTLTRGMQLNSFIEPASPLAKKYEEYVKTKK